MVKRHFLTRSPFGRANGPSGGSSSFLMRFLLRHDALGGLWRVEARA